MSELLTLLKREWWEWRRVTVWTVGVFSFLLLLTLVPMNRLSQKIESELVDKMLLNEMDLEELSQEKKDEITFSMSLTNENYNVDDFLNMGKLLSKEKQIIEEKLAESPMTIIKPYSYGILAGFSMIQLFVMFIGLFYFSDSLYKERSNDSTLYFRSLPVSDHWILFSKLKAGAVGIIGLTISMLSIYLVYSQLAIRIVSGEIWEVLSGTLSQINMIDLFFDLIVYQVIALIWMSPLILFLMLISATVRNRPLIAGIGLPILFSITLQVIFGENAFVSEIVNIFVAIPTMINDQNLINSMETVPGDGVDLFASFFGDLFSLRTLGSLVLSGLFYLATLKLYRKNIPTN